MWLNGLLYNQKLWSPLALSIALLHNMFSASPHSFLPAPMPQPWCARATVLQDVDCPRCTACMPSLSQAANGSTSCVPSTFLPAAAIVLLYEMQSKQTWQRGLQNNEQRGHEIDVSRPWAHSSAPTAPWPNHRSQLVCRSLISSPLPSNPLLSPSLGVRLRIRQRAV